MKVLVATLLFLLFANSLQAQHTEKDTLLLGVFPYVSASRVVEIYSPLARYLEQKLDKKIAIVTAPGFKEFVERTDNRRYDIIFTAPHFALHAERLNLYQRLCRFKNRLHGVLFVANDHEFSSIDSLKGQIVALPDRLAIVSALSEVYFKRQGFKVGGDLHLLHTTSHNNAILAVLNGKAMAGVVARPVFNMFSKKKPGKIKFVAETDTIPGAMFMMNSDLSLQDKQLIQASFQEFPRSQLGKTFFSNSPFVGFEKVTKEELKMLESYEMILEKYL